MMDNPKMQFAYDLCTEGALGFKGCELTECEAFGMTYGCKPDCPAYMKGLCENKEDAEKMFNIKQ